MLLLGLPFTCLMLAGPVLVWWFDISLGGRVMWFFLCVGLAVLFGVAYAYKLSAFTLVFEQETLRVERRLGPWRKVRQIPRDRIRYVTWEINSSETVDKPLSDPYTLDVRVDGEDDLRFRHLPVERALDLARIISAYAGEDVYDLVEDRIRINRREFAKKYRRRWPALEAASPWPFFWNTPNPRPPRRREQPRPIASE